MTSLVNVSQWMLFSQLTSSLRACAREEKAKTLRLKKLLAAADKRLKQAESDLDVRDAEIAALKYRLSLNS